MPTATPGGDALLAGTLALALAPVLGEVAVHVAANPWAAYVLGMLPLCVLAFALAPPGRRPHRDGVAWIALALVLELLGLLAGPAQLGRLAIPLACLGFARLRGRPGISGALLGCWLVPVPNALLRVVSPGLESLLLAIAAHAAALFGSAPRLEGVEVVVGDAALRVLRGDGGVPLALALAGLGWYRAVRRDARIPAAIASAAGAAAAAPAIQLGALLAAILALPRLGSEATRALLTHGPWLAVCSAGLALAERGARPARLAFAGTERERVA